MNRKEAYQLYSTAAIEKVEMTSENTSLYTVSCAGDFDYPIAFWVPTKQDAMAIAMGLKIYAECIKEEIRHDEQVEKVAKIIMELSKNHHGGIGHG